MRLLACLSLWTYCNAANSLISNAGLATVTDGAASEFFSLNGSIEDDLTAEARAQIPVRDAGTFSKLFVRVFSNTTTTAVATVTLRKSLADTALLVSITAGTTGIFEDQTNTVAFAATDEADYEFTVPNQTGSAKTVSITQVGVQFAPDTAGNSISFLAATGNAGGFFSESTTLYYPPSGGSFFDTPFEANTKYRIRVATTTSDFYVYIQSNARTTATTFGTRKNGAAGAQSVSVGATATGAFEDTTNSDSLADGDDYNYFSTTGTGTGTIVPIVGCTTAITTGGEFFLIANDAVGSSFPANQTSYSPPAGGNFGPTPTEANIQIYPRFTFTARQLQSSILTNTVTATSTITLRDNGANGNESLSIPSSTTGLFVDASNTDTITSGTDEINYQVVTGATGTSMDILHISVLGDTDVGPPPSSDAPVQIIQSQNQATPGIGQALGGRPPRGQWR